MWESLALDTVRLTCSQTRENGNLGLNVSVSNPCTCQHAAPRYELDTRVYGKILDLNYHQTVLSTKCDKQTKRTMRMQSNGQQRQTPHCSTTTQCSTNIVLRTKYEALRPLWRNNYCML